MPTSTVAGGASEMSMVRRLAGTTLLVGGAPALIAAFLPFMRTEWPAIAGDLAGGVDYDLIRSLLTPAGPLVMQVQSELCGELTLLGAPVGLAALGALTLWARHWTPGRRSFFIGFALLAIGTTYALINVAVSFFPVWDSGVETRRLEYGAGVMLLGYLLALVGVILLPRLTPLSAQARNRE